ncbi:VWA-like domain-containing protein [Maridesulfovibrio sp.]|uniref:vWA domain-containing protein n=1 Tax=Maridesulfovibrio sp. TaxID=2795000 RepID=UPI0029F52EF1|nr:VWA-like domain-containing protein [Maridesulfovibrio sp.]
MNADRKLLKARADLLLRQPFFGSLCLRMVPHEDSTCNGTWTDGKTLAYNPHFVDRISHEELQGVLAHTVMHPACQHHKRRGNRDARLWNMACDYSINWILLEAGFTLPDGFMDDEKYHGKNAEEIFTDLTKNFDQAGNPEIGKQQDGPKRIDIEYEDGKGEGNDLEAGEDDERSPTGEDGESSTEGIDSEEIEDSEGETDEEQSADPGGTGEVRDADDAESGNGESGDETDKDWLQALAQAVNLARDCGDLPGGLGRFVQNMLYPKVDWRELLDRFISARARNDYAWTPPSRRHLHLGMYLPSLSTEQLPEIVLAVDTSGSIAPDELDQFATELSSILETYETTVRVLWCDLEITGEQLFSRADLPLELQAEGGGGTDFRPVFNWIEQNYIDPACLVYLSDMECGQFPEHEPDYPVLWARTGGGGYSPPFGDMIDVC